MTRAIRDRRHNSTGCLVYVVITAPADATWTSDNASRFRFERAGERARASTAPAQQLTITEMVAEVIDLSAGLGIMLLPLCVMALPLIALVVAPVVVVGAAAAVVVRSPAHSSRRRICWCASRGGGGCRKSRLR